MALSLPIPAPRPGRRYLRPPAPLVFPSGADVPESDRHKRIIVVLWQSVLAAFGNRALVASDMFLYWDPTNPKRCLAPDLMVRVGTEPESLQSWKTWDKGAPHVGVEIVSDWDRAEMRVEEKLERYRQVGILEVVRYDPENRATPLRLWDLFDGDLVERDLADPEAYRCDALGLYWCIHDDATLGPTLRLARGSGCAELIPTPEEAERAAKQAALAEKQAILVEKQAEQTAKEAALAELAAVRARLAELEGKR